MTQLIEPHHLLFAGLRGRVRWAEGDARRLPPILLESTALEAVAPEFALPWIEGDHAFATDGAIATCVARAAIDPDAFRRLPARAPWHPKGFLEYLRQFGPFHDQPCRLPPPAELPDRDRATPRPPADEPVWFTMPTPYHGRIGLDARYVTLLRRHEAVVQAPATVKADRIGPFRFQCGPHVWGLIQPVAEPRKGVPWQPSA